jgi:hypothetical protein
MDLADQGWGKNLLNQRNIDSDLRQMSLSVLHLTEF